MSNDITTRKEYELSEDVFSEVDFLRQEMSERKTYSDSIIDAAADAVAGGSYIRDLMKASEDVKYEVVLSSEIKEAIKEGSKKFDSNKAGEIFAQIRDADGRLSKKIPIREIPEGVGINPVELSNALRMKAIEEKLDSIVDTLEVIEIGIKGVLAGQENDRIALYFSGINLYREAIQVQDHMLRSLVMSQAIKTISDAYSQESQSIKADVEYLISGKHLSLKKPKDEIEKRLSSINKCFQIVHKAAVFKAGIYYKNGEVGAMLEVLDEYGRFLNKTIAPNVGKLAEMDQREKFIDGSSWSRKANFTESIAEIKLMIPEQQYLPIGENSNGQERQTH